MTKKLLISFLVTASLAACGSKAKKTTMPENKGDTSTEMKSSGSSTGGTTYGGAITPAKTGGADPCGG
ncbi:MAG: hypothetical protein JWO36_273 [Myxococcales bacterium]|nr:hypothetical protein [Myxococcales bacterium]